MRKSEVEGQSTSKLAPRSPPIRHESEPSMRTMTGYYTNSLARAIVDINTAIARGTGTSILWCMAVIY